MKELVDNAKWWGEEQNKKKVKDIIGCGGIYDIDKQRRLLCYLLDTKDNAQTREKLLNHLSSEGFDNSEANERAVRRIFGKSGHDISEDEERLRLNHLLNYEKCIYEIRSNKLRFVLEPDGSFIKEKTYPSMSFERTDKRKGTIHYVHPLMTECYSLFGMLPLAVVATLSYHPPLHPFNHISLIRGIEVVFYFILFFFFPCFICRRFTRKTLRLFVMRSNQWYFRLLRSWRSVAFFLSMEGCLGFLLHLF
jgi:hypothetical protein